MVVVVFVIVVVVVVLRMAADQNGNILTPVAIGLVVVVNIYAV